MARKTTNVPVGLEWLAEEEAAEAARIAAQDGERVQQLRAQQDEKRRAERARAAGTYRNPDAIVIPWLDAAEKFVADLTV